MIVSWAAELSPETESDRTANREVEDEHEVLRVPHVADAGSTATQEKRRKVGDFRAKARRTLETVSNPVTSLEQQWTYYIAGDFDSDVDHVEPISFWQRSAVIAKMPALAKLAHLVLTVPATSAPVERVFSHGGILMRPHRASLSDANLAALIFLKCNRL